MLPPGSSVSSAGLEARLYGRRGRPPPQTALANSPQRSYSQDMKPNFFFSRICHSPILRRFAVTLVVLALIGIAGCSKKEVIHDAARDGDLATVKTLLTAHPDLVNSQDTNGMTPLHFAAHNGSNDMVEFLLTSKADVNARDKYGTTPLEEAAQWGHKDVAELLLDNKADVNARDNFGWTPLHRAALRGRKDVAELLLDKGADVNAKASDGATPLRYAAMLKRNRAIKGDIAELLLAHGADVNARDTNGLSPLIIAVHFGNKDMVELLLTNKADANAKNNDSNTPLDYAIKNGYKDVADLLRQHGGTNGLP
jgi:ankyrin repeat protein